LATADDIEYGDFRPYIASTRGLIKDYQERAYSHLLNELLYAAANKESVFALKEYGITSLSLYALLNLIPTPGTIVGLRRIKMMIERGCFMRISTGNYLHYIRT